MLTGAFISHGIVFVLGVDEGMVVTLKFSRNRMAVFTCSIAVELPNDAVIIGTKGTIRVGSTRDTLLQKHILYVESMSQRS